MRMNVWGIETYKLGVTTRTLEARYREFLDKIYFETVLDELDALMLEALLHQRYKSDQDLRVKKKGMRDGGRWPGDEELYFKRVIKPMLADLKKHASELEEKDPNYWERYPELELPSAEPRKSEFRPGEYNKEKPVICLDTMDVFPSSSEAARQLGMSQGNISNVCRGESGSTKGRRFAYLTDYENGTIPEYVASRGARCYVHCIDTGEVFDSLSEAAKVKGVQASKISTVCKDKRKSTGGLRWEYADEH